MSTSVFEEYYKKQVVPQLMKDLGYKNVMQIPKLLKIVVNTSISEATQNAKVLDSAAAEIAQITGQKPVITRAKKSIAAFKLREGQAIGACVTLRKKKMFEFFNRLVNVALPRVRDFKGVSAKSFDGRGNYTMGITEQIIFAEINYDRVEKIRGLNITFCTNAKTDDEARALLRALGMPFRN
ncbi:MAG: 50S ribosomal protein L5 [Deltaproteobacteria bacterium]|nr:50S ribosomal protein L5 [Deltaproteobacteria bacterium]